jgi:CRISPR-associated Csx2 family protein
MPAHLLTTLGVGNYELVRWRLGEDRGTYQTCYAPVATTALIGDVDRVTVLLTDEAREKHWDGFRAEVTALEIEVAAERIPAGRSETEIWEVFSGVDCALRGAGEVVLDVTHAFRSLPLVLFGSLTYLAALRDFRVRGVYYGAWEARAGDEAPLLDLTPLPALLQWSYGARAFRETGNVRWLAELLRETKALLFRRAAASRALGRLEAAFQVLGWTIPTGLPLESGIHARKGLDALDSIRTDRPELTPLRPLVDELRETLEAIAIPSRTESKSAIALDTPEMSRQLRLARLYHRWGLDDRALLLLREWIVSRTLLAAGRGGKWLDYGGARRPVERAITALVERRRLAGREDAPDQSPLRSLWSRIADRRNRVAHAGIGPEMVNPVADVVKQLLLECELRTGDSAAWSTARPGPTRRLLVTPFGRAPGVLFTALTRRAPDIALVVTSREARSTLDEVRTRSGWGGAAHVFEVADAHACFGEVRRVIDWARPHLLEASQIDINITGGTTALQYLAERVAGEASRLGVPFERIALIDRRELAEQTREPYVVGDVVPLTDDEPSRTFLEG